MGFIFGPGTDAPSYEALKKKRDIIDALRQQSLAPQQGWTGAAGQIGQALIARFGDSRLAPKEDAERQRISDLLMGGFGGRSLDGGAGTPAFAPEMPQGDSASLIRQELVKRGLPEHVADGFVMNFKDESALNPAAVEQGGGGYGLAQWTGPRRQGLEQFAQSAGKPVSDTGTQLDYLMNELQGPEAGAAAKIMGTQGAGDAAAAIAKYFERPAAGPLAARLADYTGGGGGGSGGSSAPDMGRLSQLAEVVGDPYADEGQKLVATALIKQMIPEPITPYQQAQLGMQGDRIAQTQNGVYGTPVYGQSPDGSWGVGAIGKDGTFHKLDTGDFAPSAPGTKLADQGTQFQPVDRNGNPSAPPLPIDNSGKAAQTIEGQTQGNAQAQMPMQKQLADEVTGQIDAIYSNERLPELVGKWKGPNRPEWLRTQEGINFQSDVAKLGGTAFLQARQLLKGGGQITDYEGQQAQDALAALSTSQDADTFRRHLKQFRDHIQRGFQILQSQAAGGGQTWPGAPAVGTIVNGLTYNGGDPNSMASWVKQ